MTTPYSTGRASDRQVALIRSLIDEKDLLAGPRIFDACNAMDAEEFAAYKERLKADAANLTGGRDGTASRWISKLLDLPRLRAERPTQPNAAGSGADIPEGRYAVTGSDGETDFFLVQKPERGRWAGYTFVKKLIACGGFGNEFRKVRVNRETREKVLRQINQAGVREAMLRFGREVGACGHCGRNLTNDESRALGIGPVCRRGMGWS